MEMGNKAKQVFKRGEDAYRAGKATNPYDYLSGKSHMNRNWWQMGFDKAKSENQEG